MRRIRRLSAWLAIAVFCAVTLYGIPTLLELFLLNKVQPVAELLIGDFCGCLVLAIVNWKKGLGLYIGLTLLEFLLLARHVVQPAQIVWFSDLLPTVIIFFVLARRMETFTSAAQMEDAPAAASLDSAISGRLRQRR